MKGSLCRHLYIRTYMLVGVLTAAFSRGGAQVPAFPGAEGGGRLAAGGRGGKVIEVTNLNDSGPGSLRAAIQAAGARTVVFRISGTIILNSPLSLQNDSITIAGQSAPGDGICLRKYPLVIKANHVILRYLRFRLGDESGGENDAISGFTNSYTDFVNRANKHHIIVDHCSASWSEDETLSFYGNDSVTVQWCIISESLYNSNHPKGSHGYGGIWGGRNTSFHHNLLAHHDSRNPRFSGGLPTRSNGTVPSENVDFRNNVIYNWGSNSSYGGESSTVNIVANYYKPGPATRTRNRIAEPYGPSNGGGASLGQWFVADNHVEGYAAITSDNWAGGVQGSYAGDPTVRATSPFPFAPVTTQTAMQAYANVLADAGATLPVRDAVDARIVQEVRNGSVTYGGKTYGKDKMGGDTVNVYGILDSQNDVGGWPLLKSVSPPTDTDHDGMPDLWENARGLDPNNPEDRNQRAPDGYTMLETYLNFLTLPPTSIAKTTVPVPSDFVLLPNYPNPFNPETTVAYELPSGGAVSVRIYDIYGRMVRELHRGEQGPGMHSVRWDGRDRSAMRVASGVYFAVVQFQENTKVLKLQLIK